MINGVDGAVTAVTSCTDLAATIDLDNDERLEVVSKLCGICDSQRLYPCECKIESGATVMAKISGVSNDVCNLDCAGTPPPNTLSLPANNRTWLDGDCVHPAQFLLKISAFPPSCINAGIEARGKRAVFVNKITEGDSPNIDNAIVQQYDWYLAVYNIGDDTLLGVYYEYEACCINDTPENPATSHFAWVVIRNVQMMGSTYDCWIYNNATAAAHGNCGVSAPTCS